MDLVTVAQALHWFDVEAFYAEARARGAAAARCSRCGTTHGRNSSDAQLDRAVPGVLRDVVGPYWPPNGGTSRLTTRTLPFPFEELPHPQFGLDAANGISSRCWAT